MLKTRPLAIFVATLCLSGTAFSQEMRCGNRLIAGDQIKPLLKDEVLQICGEPTKRDYDRWFYQQQGKILVFNDNDELDHIEDASSIE